MKATITLHTSLAVLIWLTGTAQAQWLNHRTPGIPRLPDGKPNLAAPTPRTPDGKPDLSGLWATPCLECGPSQRLFFDLAKDLNPADVQMTPWAAAIQKQRESRDHVDDPFGYCLPPGVPRMHFVIGSYRIVSTPAVTAFLHETAVGMIFRTVFTDGRSLPTVSEPTWLGYSIGRWEGDTFVVETAGFNDGGWLDTAKGRPHSDALHLTERFRRRDFGHIDLSITIDDPKAYLKPWTVTTVLTLQADTEMLESFCDNHDKTMEHRRITPPPVEPPSPASGVR
jgi:hypothetical protein